MCWKPGGNMYPSDGARVTVGTNPAGAGEPGMKPGGGASSATPAGIAGDVGMKPGGWASRVAATTGDVGTKPGGGASITSRASASSSQVSWGPCPSGLMSMPANDTCGSYEVPLDWNKPNDYKEASRLATLEADKLADEQFGKLRDQLSQIEHYKADGYCSISKGESSQIRMGDEHV